MQEHGTFNIDLRGQTVRVKLYDQWNYEVTVRFVQEFKLKALTICNKPWACVVDLSEWELGTPDIWELLEEGNVWSSEHNQKYEASISQLAVHKQIMEKTDESFSNVETKAFNNETQALAWLESVGIKTTA